MLGDDLDIIRVVEFIGYAYVGCRDMYIVFKI